MEKDDKQNERLPTVAFRCSQEFKEKIKEYAFKNGYVNDFGEPVMSPLIFAIVNEHFESKGVLKIKREWTI